MASDSKEQPAPRRKKRAPDYRPWHPPKYEPGDASAIQATAQGTGSPEQQTRAMRWIIYNLCGTYDLPYIPDSARDTDFSLGKQFVGQQLVKMINIKVGKLTGKETEQP